MISMVSYEKSLLNCVKGNPNSPYNIRNAREYGIPDSVIREAVKDGLETELKFYVKKLEELEKKNPKLAEMFEGPNKFTPEDSMSFSKYLAKYNEHRKYDEYRHRFEINRKRLFGPEERLLERSELGHY